MPTIQVPTSELLRAVRQLSPSELEEVAAEVLALRSRELALRSEATEQELLDQIEQRRPEAEQRRFEELVGRREREVITAEELAELRQLTEQGEQLAVTRLQALCELARRRGTTLSALADELDIKASGHE
jgi:hypothetical protein